LKNDDQEFGLLWIKSADEALDNTTELLSAIAPQWEVVRARSFGPDEEYGSPGYRAAHEAAERKWRHPAPEQLQEELDAQTDGMVETSVMPDEMAACNAIPLSSDENDPLLAAYRALCEANMRERRLHMRVSGQYVCPTADQAPDLLVRNENQATLRVMLRYYWSPVAYGESAQYAIAPCTQAGGRGALARWLEHSEQDLARSFLRDRGTAAADGLEILCVSGVPDWDSPMGILMLFATPALARQHMQRLRHDPRVQWWPDVAAADARWRRDDWPPAEMGARVHLCPFDLRRDRVWDGDKQKTLL